MTKKSALAPGCIVDTAALHRYNTTNFVEYAGLELRAAGRSVKLQAAGVKHQAIQVAGNKRQATSSKHQAASLEQQAPRFDCPHKDARD